MIPSPVSPSLAQTLASIITGSSSQQIKQISLPKANLTHFFWRNSTVARILQKLRSYDASLTTLSSLYFNLIKMDITPTLQLSQHQPSSFLQPGKRYLPSSWTSSGLLVETYLTSLHKRYPRTSSSTASNAVPTCHW